MKKLLEHLKKQQEARAKELAKIEERKKKNILEAEKVYKLEEQEIKDRKRKKLEAIKAKRKKLQEEEWDKKIKKGLDLADKKINEDKRKDTSVISIFRKEEQKQIAILEEEKRRQVRLRLSRERKAKENKERVNSINVLLANRVPAPEVLPWKKWIDNPANKEIYLFDPQQAENLFLDDNYDAKQNQKTYKRGKGIKARPVAVPVVPTDIEGLKVWLDADNAADITIGYSPASGDYISQWKSKVDDSDDNSPYYVNWGLKQTVTNNMPRYDDHPSGRKTIHFDKTYAEHFDTFWFDYVNSWVGSDEWSWAQTYPAYTVFIHGSLEAGASGNYLFDVESPRSALIAASTHGSAIYREGYVAEAPAKTGEQLWTFSNVESPKHVPTYVLTEETDNPGMIDLDPIASLKILVTGNDDTSTALLNVFLDDFTFDGVSYTQVSVNSNGFLTLGAAYSGSTKTYDNTRLDDSDSDVVIAPWWDDLKVDTDDVWVSWFPEYTIFQWHCKQYNSWNTTFKMQAVLYLDNHPTQPGTIEFRYGDTVGTATTNGSATIGVKGITNILPGTASVNYHNWRTFYYNNNHYLDSNLDALNHWPGTATTPFYYKLSPTVQTDEHKSKIFSDGELVASAYSTKAVDLQNSHTANKNQKVGSRHGATNGHQGNINEMIVYDRILTADERAKVETYLAEKWGTTVATSSYASYKHPWSD